jgi:DNA repair protein RadC
VELTPVDLYVVRITLDRALVSVQQVAPPRQLVRAVDHPAAFDEAAYAAMSFFSVEGGFDDAQAESNEAGWLIRRHSILRVEVATIGSARFTVVDPQGLYRLALLYRASAIALAHNHPGGDPRPSQQDLEVTRVVEAAGKVLGIELLDHLVVTRDGYRSIREQLGFAPGNYGPNIVQSR